MTLVPFDDGPTRTEPESRTNLIRAVKAAIRRNLFAPPDMLLPEWADAYRRLSPASGAVGGQFETRRVEVARGPMLATDEPGVVYLTIMVATQLMKTTIIENVIGKHIHLDPCPILVVQPKDDMVEAFSKERLAPMFQSTPVLKERVGDTRTRKGDNTLGYKRFPGGHVAIVSAGSPTNLAMRASRITLLDEIDKYATTKEGDPVLLAEERGSTFSNRLHIRACSPTSEETSRIYKSYLESDQRKAYVPCPHCGHAQDLDFFRHVHWEKKGSRHTTETAAIYCEACGAAWTERQRLDALQDITWRQTATFICCEEGQDPRSNRLWEFDDRFKVGYALCSHCGRRAISNHHTGVTASKLYSPFLTMAELASKWIESEKDPESKQTFYNTQLGLPYRIEATREVSASTIATRQEIYDEVPNRVLVITAGVDVHPGSKQTPSQGRIEVEAVGWDQFEESWSLAYRVFHGDPARPEVWNELDKFLLTPFRRQDGHKMRILGVCVDSGGHNTQEAYGFAVARAGRNVWAIKGASDRGGQWTPVWPVHNSRRNHAYRGSYRPVLIGVNAAKEAIRQRLLITEPGPGYCHFPTGRPASYFDQLTVERLIIERKAGVMVRYWHLPNHRSNEALDNRVYAYAALHGLIHERGLDFKKLVKRVEAMEIVEPSPIVVEDEPPVVARPTEKVAVAPHLVTRRQPVTRSNFMQMRRF